MILANETADVVVIGDDTSRKATISQDKLAKLQYLLTKGLYKDPITAVIAEWTNNGIDAIVQAGKNPIENPVLVKITKNNGNQYTFSVEDKGTGLDDKDFSEICMNYLESTKEDSNDTIGHFGIGMKSFLSLERAATFTCRKNGKERKYLVYEGPEFVNYDMIYEKDTDEENGVLAELTIVSWSERDLFVNKAKSKLAYYDTAVLIIDDVPVVNTIFRHELFQWSSSQTSTNMHIALKDVYYPIDYEALDIRPISFPVAIRIGLDEGVKPTPSRESYISNEHVKELILKRIKEIADWFVTEHNKTVNKYDNFLDAYPYINYKPVLVKVGSTTFNISSISSRSSILLEYHSFREYTISQLKEFATSSMLSKYLENYIPVAYVGCSSTMHVKARRLAQLSTHLFGYRSEVGISLRESKVVIVDNNFIGNVKTFLKDKHGNITMFVTAPVIPMTLGRKSPVYNKYTYYDVLSLFRWPKNKWREKIKDFQLVQSQIVEMFIDERNVASSKEFLDWIDAKKERQKQTRANNKVLGISTGLNKQVGDVTIAYAHKYHYHKVAFKKAIFKIENLHLNKYLTVLVSPEEEQEAKNAAIMLIKNKKIRFAVVGKLEMKKIPKHYQFITYKQFMSIECKPFLRLASAILFDRALKEFNSIKGFKDGVFVNILKGLTSDETKLQKYVSENLYDCGKDSQKAILDYALEHKIFDYSLWNEYLHVKEAAQKYDFIHLLSTPNSWDKLTIDKYQRLITQILLFRKKYYNDLPEGTKIVFEEPIKGIEVEDEVEDETEVNDLVTV